MAHAVPLLGGGMRLALLQAVCAAAEHGEVHVRAEHETAAARVVRAVLRNTRSFSNLGGVTGHPRSLNSVYAAAVALYVNAGFQGRLKRSIARPSLCSLAVTRDGCTLLVSSFDCNAFYVINESNGLLRHSWQYGTGPLEFHGPKDVWVASDDHVFVAEWHNRRIQVLTPRFEFQGFIKTQSQAVGVCADTDIVAVSEIRHKCIRVYSRHNCSLLYCIGCDELLGPATLCLLPSRRQIACVDLALNRMSVFSIETGRLVRHESCEGSMRVPCSLAVSGNDELFVGTHSYVVVFNADGRKLKSINISGVRSIALHGCNMYTSSWDGLFKCSSDW